MASYAPCLPSFGSVAPNISMIKHLHACCLMVRLRLRCDFAPVVGEFLVCRNPPARCSLARTGGDGTVRSIRERLILVVHLLVTVANFSVTLDRWRLKTEAMSRRITMYASRTESSRSPFSKG